MEAILALFFWLVISNAKDEIIEAIENQDKAENQGHPIDPKSLELHSFPKLYPDQNQKS